MCSGELNHGSRTLKVESVELLYFTFNMWTLNTVAF